MSKQIKCPVCGKTTRNWLNHLNAKAEKEAIVNSIENIEIETPHLNYIKKNTIEVKSKKIKLNYENKN
mgnify:CR=1 FL=1